MTQNPALDDLLAPEVIRDPYPMLKALRERSPLHFNPRWKGWVMTSYDGISEAHRHPALSNDKYEPFTAMKTRTPDQEAVFSWLGLWLGSQDPPLHTRLRSSISKAFTSRASVEALEPGIAAVVDELLSGVLARGEMDLVHDFAYPLTTAVIGAMLGMPREDLHRVQPWAEGVAPIMFMTLGEKNRYQRARVQLDDMAHYFSELLRERQAHPKEDLMTALAESIAHGELSEREVIATAMVVIFGGHETTKDLLGNGVLALLRDQDARRQLQDDPGLMGTAIEELLRFDSPAKSTVRWASEETEICGQRVEKGQRILMFWSGANRDPAQFHEPDRLDLARSPNQHLAFGKGVHYCVGAPVARLEARLALRALLDRFPAMKLAVPESELSWHPTIIMRSLTSLPVALV